MRRLWCALGLCAALGCGSKDTGGSARAGAGGETATAGRAAADGGRGDGGAGAAADGGRGGAAGGAGTQAGRGGGGGRAGQGGASGASGAAAGGGAGAAAGSGADASAELFDPEKLPRFDIDLSSDAVSALTSAPATYARGTLRYGDTMLQDVGVRIKGEASLRTLEQKAALKLKFDEFVKDQALLGMHRLTLNNMVADPTFIAERVAYEMFRAAGLPAPRCNSALVYVNGDYMGVYANVESEDKPFIRRWFTSDAGNLYEDGQADLEPGNEMYFDLETNETANDRSDLQALTSALAAASGDSYLSDLSGTLDTDLYLRFAALEATVNQWDGYSYTYYEPNNFRLYHDPVRGKFVFLPWGLDMALKPFPDNTGLNQIPVLVVPRYENRAPGDPKARDAGGLIWKKCIMSSTCKLQLAAALRSAASLLDAQDFAARAEHYYAQVKDHVYEETRKETTNEEFDAAYKSLLAIIRGRAAAIRGELTAAGL